MSRLVDRLYAVQGARPCGSFSLDTFVNYRTRKVDREGLTNFLQDTFAGISEDVSCKEETVARCIGIGATGKKVGVKFSCIDDIPNVVSRRDLITWFKYCHLEVSNYAEEKARKRSRAIRRGRADCAKDYPRPPTNRSGRAG